MRLSKCQAVFNVSQLNLLDHWLDHRLDRLDKRTKGQKYKGTKGQKNLKKIYI
jgi:hypothetical protein